MKTNNKPFTNKYLANRIVVPIYHVANLFDNRNFCSDPWLKYSKRDGYWGGAGMYFWSNYNDALFWYNLNKHRYNHKHGSMSIAKATLNITPISMLLNLTDRSQIRLFNDDFRYLINRVKKTINISRFLRRFSKSGGKLNWYYYSFKMLNSGLVPFDAIKINGDYHSLEQPVDSTYASQELYDGPHITDNIKSIYIVKNPKVIINREIIRVL